MGKLVTWCYNRFRRPVIKIEGFQQNAIIALRSYDVFTIKVDSLVAWAEGQTKCFMQPLWDENRH